MSMIPKPQAAWSVIILSLVFFADQSWAHEYAYQGKVEGMVCAFCAYNVSRKIGALEGVDDRSVNVDLESGRVEFSSVAAVDKSAISSLFTDTGFKLTVLEEVGTADLVMVNFSNRPLMTLIFSRADLARLDPVLDAIGALAAAHKSQITLKALPANEIDILKPILAGRQKVIKVRSTAVADDSVELSVFLSQR